MGEKLEREDKDLGNESPEMETPIKKEINDPVSQFEDSPVFNFINSLSPLKAVKSLRISQRFNSCSFPSVPSVFTSPQVSATKGKQHHFSDPSNINFSSENGNGSGGTEGVMDVIQDSGKQGENCEVKTHESSKLATEFLQSKPESETNPCAGIKMEFLLEGTSRSEISFVQEATEASLVENEIHFEGIRDMVKNEQGAECDWNSLISAAPGFLIFDSSEGTEAFNKTFQKPLDFETSLCESLISEFTIGEISKLQNAQAVDTVGIRKCESELILSRVGEGKIGADRNFSARTSLDILVAEEPTEQLDNESFANIHRGMRRRCLVFEMGGASEKQLLDCSCPGHSMLSQSDIKTECIDKQLVYVKPDNDSSHCIVPGIGLHLNALARSSNNNVIGHEFLSSERQLMNDSSSTTTRLLLTTGQDHHHRLLAVTSMERDTSPAENGGHDSEDAPQTSGYIATEEINQNSPKKKRLVKRKMENDGENEGCKRCNCKKSKCLKLYCECFAAGVYCMEPCSCQECFNKPIHEDTVLATRKQIETRNPLAFAPKVVRSSDHVLETRDESSNTPASARHKRGCNCKKSGCLKKYCECYQEGVGCSVNCRCEGCKNAFGKKDEIQLQEEKSETQEKSVVDNNLQGNVIQNHVQQNQNDSLPETPLRSSVQLPFSYRRKSPRSLFLSIGSSSKNNGNRKFETPSCLQPQHKFEKGIQGDKMPEILQGNFSSFSILKSASPKRKRVSPPHCEFGRSPNRSSRKLILQSIPSFPSLTPKQ